MSIKGIFPIDRGEFKIESVLAYLPTLEYELLMAGKTGEPTKKGKLYSGRDNTLTTFFQCWESE